MKHELDPASSVVETARGHIINRGRIPCGSIPASGRELIRIAEVPGALPPDQYGKRRRARLKADEDVQPNPWRTVSEKLMKEGGAPIYRHKEGGEA